MQKSQVKLEKTILTSDIGQSLAVAFERTNSIPKNLIQMTNDIATEFKGVPVVTIQKAIRNGSLGMYGKTFGELSTQEICIWIRKLTDDSETTVAPKMNT